MFQVKSNLKLPSSFNSNPLEAARNPEDVLDYIPGDCWVSLLTTASDEDVASYEKLLSDLVTILLDLNYKKFQKIQASNYGLVVKAEDSKKSWVWISAPYIV